ncbi:hypothetical protein DSM25558_3205 [Agrobacterium sp. DSM 25558]|uniref:hypothetical protein n=1 Tax=Agrobacterium sp. DSM 25558 TaxID=1907665 RepID=UPI00097254D5|nr:hypothetical protein [Agrobacterium sp. DSM 25558]SCX22727.1 hypothetical protein DSM25558_3205 [Agrobacterium sp. DSM 25558]
MMTGGEISSVDPVFIAQACNWMRNPAVVLLKPVFAGHERMLAENPFVDGRDPERSISQLLEPRIRDVMSGDEPFYVQHGPYERETMAAPPAQPPQYDLAFVLRADERVMWPLEAKVLETPNQMAAYERDIREEFLTCRYAPFSSSGAMVGFLLSGSTDDARIAIQRKLGTKLCSVKELASKPAWVSYHSRIVPPGKTYPPSFDCYHLVLAYPDVQRTKN